MKPKAKKILISIIRLLAILTLKRYRPGIIGITGTVGKTSTKQAVYAVLKSNRSVRASFGNFNNEIGLPLTILGDWTQIAGIFFWPKVILISIFKLIFTVKYPEILVLEYGVDKPGDMKYLLEIARPNIGILTAIGDIPVHVEFYASPEEVFKEKSRLAATLPANGFLIINHDDVALSGARDLTRAHVLSYGFDKEASIKITAFENTIQRRAPTGISFKLEYGGSFVPVRLLNCLGKSQAYVAAAAAAVGLAFGMNLVKIAEALNYYQAPPHRMKIIPGIKKTLLIDDSYNASPLSMEAALQTLKSLPGKRKLAVLGDMLELGRYSIEAHEGIGRLIPKAIDILMVVGPRAKFIAEEANRRGFKKKDTFVFNAADEAGKTLQSLMKAGDLVLIKGSRAVQLDKVVDEVKAI